MLKIHQFLLWLLRPVLTAFIDEWLAAQPIPEPPPELKLQPMTIPALDTLMVVESVAYAAEKFERDLEIAQRFTERERTYEILQWAKFYLQDKGWVCPSSETLVSVLALRDSAYGRVRAPR